MLGSILLPEYRLEGHSIFYYIYSSSTVHVLSFITIDHYDFVLVTIFQRKSQKQTGRIVQILKKALQKDLISIETVNVASSCLELAIFTVSTETKRDWAIPVVPSWFFHNLLLFSSPEPKAQVSYCHSAPSVVRPSVRRRRPSSGVNFSHFRLLLQNRLMDFDETWYHAWSTRGPLQVLLFFGQIRPGADPGRGQNRKWGVPFFKKLLLQTGRLQGQTECIAMI